MTKMILALAIGVAALLAAPGAGAQPDLRIIDGDTLAIGETTYRLHGIDAPELAQGCATPSDGEWACGTKAKEALEALAEGADVQCEGLEEDGYGRVVAVCRADGTDVNAELVRRGLAWAFRRYSEDYAALEEEARADGVGVWRAETQTPWDFRANRWSAAAEDAPEGCPIKGNISANGRIYHAPWSRWYGRTRIDTSKGERWFCDEAEAVAAGWRAPER